MLHIVQYIITPFFYSGSYMQTTPCLRDPDHVRVVIKVSDQFQAKEIFCWSKTIITNCTCYTWRVSRGSYNYYCQVVAAVSVEGVDLHNVPNSFLICFLISNFKNPPIKIETEKQQCPKWSPQNYSLFDWHCIPIWHQLVYYMYCLE